VTRPTGGAAYVVLISGSTRSGSTNTAALRTAAALEVQGVAATLWDRLVDVPAFVPDDDVEPPPVVRELRGLLASADAVVFCTPEYAGSLPGSLKNVLDWLVGSGELYRKPVAWITVAHPGRGEGARATLATVVGYEGAEIVEPACVRVPVGREMVDPDGTVHDPDVRARLAAQLATVAAHVRATAAPDVDPPQPASDGGGGGGGGGAV
jgi:chromate reductase